MRYLAVLALMILYNAAMSQNSVFRAALVSELRQLEDQEELIVEYKKTGGWGDYEGGYISYILDKEVVHITLTNTNQYNKPSEVSKTAMPLKDLLNRLNTAKDKVKDPDNIAINNKIYYNITKNGTSLAQVSADLEPEQVINKVQLNPNLSEFFKKGQNKKAGILINNMY